MALHPDVAPAWIQLQDALGLHDQADNHWPRFEGLDLNKLTAALSSSLGRRNIGPLRLLTESQWKPELQRLSF